MLQEYPFYCQAENGYNWQVIDENETSYYLFLGKNNTGSGKKYIGIFDKQTCKMVVEPWPTMDRNSGSLRGSLINFVKEKDLDIQNWLKKTIDQLIKDSRNELVSNDFILKLEEIIPNFEKLKLNLS